MECEKCGRKLNKWGGFQGTALCEDCVKNKFMNYAASGINKSFSGRCNLTKEKCGAENCPEISEVIRELQ